MTTTLSLQRGVGFWHLGLASCGIAWHLDFAFALISLSHRSSPAFDILSGIHHFPSARYTFASTRFLYKQRQSFVEYAHNTTSPGYPSCSLRIASHQVLHVSRRFSLGDTILLHEGITPLPQHNKPPLTSRQQRCPSLKDSLLRIEAADADLLERLAQASLAGENTQFDSTLDPSL